MMKVTAGGKTFDVAIAILRGRQSDPNAMSARCLMTLFGCLMSSTR